MKSALVLAAFLLSSGCNMSRHIADDAIAYNETVEQQTNALLLLNVLRARDQKPMYFTNISQIRGSLTTAINGKAATPLGVNEHSDPSIEAGGTYSSNPSFDVAILDQQEFWRGITTPISYPTFKYYLGQGWPRDLLCMLFILKMEINGETYVNSPSNREDFTKFRTQLEALLLAGIVLEERDEVAESIGPVLAEDKLDIKGLTAATEKGLTVGRVGNGYQLQRLKQSLWLTNPAADPKSPPKRQAQITLRSPEAVLYYLGTIARAELDGEFQTDPIRIPGRRKKENGEYQPVDSVPLFSVKPGVQVGGADVSVQYGGVRYGVAKDGVPYQPGGSMHTLSLVHQIFALQQASKELPTTSAVTLVGR